MRDVSEYIKKLQSPLPAVRDRALDTLATKVELQVLTSPHDLKNFNHPDLLPELLQWINGSQSSASPELVRQASFLSCASSPILSRISQPRRFRRWIRFRARRSRRNLKTCSMPREASSQLTTNLRLCPVRLRAAKTRWAEARSRPPASRFSRRRSRSPPATS